MPCIRNILLDRVVTIIFDKHYLHDPEGVELLEGAVKGLQKLADAGMRFFVVTNQSGIGRGYFSEEDFFACTDRLDEMMDDEGIYFEDTLFCPHTPDEQCTCRKPLTGMWEELVESYDLKPEESIMIGDKKADVSLGLNAKLAASILVTTGKGAAELEQYAIPAESCVTPEESATEISPREENWPHCVAWDLSAAADWILQNFEAPGLDDLDDFEEGDPSAGLTELFPVSGRFGQGNGGGTGRDDDGDSRGMSDIETEGE